MQYNISSSASIDETVGGRVGSIIQMSLIALMAVKLVPSVLRRRRLIDVDGEYYFALKTLSWKRLPEGG